MNHLLVDASNLFARSFFASNTENPSGDPKFCTAFFIRTASKLMDADHTPLTDQPDRVMFLWDVEAKADKGRSEKPQHYEPSREHCQEAMAALFGKSTQGTSHGGESDDAIATLADRYVERGDTCTVVTSDKDMYQLIRPGVRYYSLHYGRQLSKQEILDKYKIKRTIQVSIALALLGDKVDNVSGVNGWGKKTVGKFFATVDPEDTFDVVLDKLQKALKPDDWETFMDCLALTLLNPSMANVGDTQPIEPAPLTELLKYIPPRPDRYDEDLDRLIGTTRSAYSKLLASVARSAISRPDDFDDDDLPTG